MVAGGVWALTRAAAVLVVAFTVSAGLAGPAALSAGARPGRGRRIGWAGAMVAGVASSVLAARAGLFMPRW